METKKKKLEYWLENIFWYHYKWYYLIGLFVLTVLIAWVVTMATHVSYDWTVVYAHRGPADPETLAKTAELFSEVAEDTDTNGQVLVDVVEILIGDTPEEPLYGPLSDSHYLIYFMDGDIADKYIELGYFEELSSGGKTVFIPSLGLYAAMNYAPYKEHNSNEHEYSVYSEAEMADLNKLMLEKHDEDAASAKESLEELENIQGQG